MLPESYWVVFFVKRATLFSRIKTKMDKVRRKLQTDRKSTANGDRCLKRESLIRGRFLVFQTFCGFKHGCSRGTAEAPSVAVTPNLCWISQSNLTASVLAAAHIQQDCSSPSLLQLWQSSSTPVESDEYQPLFVHRTFNSSALRDKVHSLTGLSCHWTGSNWPPGSASLQPCFYSLLYWLKMTLIQL